MTTSSYETIIDNTQESQGTGRKDAPSTEVNGAAVRVDIKEPKAPKRPQKIFRKTSTRQQRLRSADHCPVDETFFLTAIWYAWITPFFRKAWRGTLDREDLPSCSPHESTQVNSDAIEALWQRELACRGPKAASLARVYLRLLARRSVASSVISLLSVSLRVFSSAYLIRLLIEYCQQETADLGYGLWLAGWLLVSQYGFVICMSHTWYLNIRTAGRARAATVGMIYHKLIRLRSMRGLSIGEVVNLCANDGQRVFDMLVYMPHILCSPLLAVAALVCTFYLVGPAALLGTSVFVAFMPLQGLFSKLVAHYRQQSIAKTSRRVRLMSEIISCIKLIKMYAWEESFAATIEDIRREERGWLEKSGFLQSLVQSSAVMVPTLSTMVTLTLHTLLGHNVTAAQAFSYITVLNSLRYMVHIAPMAIKSLTEAFVAFPRIKALLLMDELEEFTDKPADASLALSLSHATLAWDKEEPTTASDDSDASEDEGHVDGRGDASRDKVDPGRETDPLVSRESLITTTLFDVNLDVKKGQLLGICGSIGSGKSSLLQAVLSRMILTEGHVAVDGGFAYVPQQACILNASLRENVLIGAEMDKGRYQEAVDVCALKEDVDLLPDGDQTEIGERGINISGGQKQRVGLARAVYSDRDIYLLDDPLAAVDAHVGKHIFSKCIEGALRGKTILFVTHQLQYLKRCDRVVLLKDGRVVEDGSHAELMANGEEYSNLIRAFHNQDCNGDDDTDDTDNSLVEEEEKEDNEEEEEEQDKEEEKKDKEEEEKDKEEEEKEEEEKEKEKEEEEEEKEEEEKEKEEKEKAEEEKEKEEKKNKEEEKEEKKEVEKEVEKEEEKEKETNKEEEEEEKKRVEKEEEKEKDEKEKEKDEEEKEVDSRHSEGARHESSLPFLTKPGPVSPLLRHKMLRLISTDSSLNGTEESEETLFYDGKLIEEEEIGNRGISMGTVRCYVQSAGGFLVVAVVLLSFLGSVGLAVFCNWWLSVWLNAGSGNMTVMGDNETDVISGSITDNPRLSFYQLVYGLSAVGFLVITAFRSFVFAKTTLQASSKLHKKVFQKVVHSPMSFFDTNPLGRILNRFSKDLDELDISFPLNVSPFLHNLLTILFSLLIMAWVFPYLLLALGLVLAPFLAFNVFARRGLRALKALDNRARSPWFAHLVTTAQSLPTLHAYGKQRDFIERFHQQMDHSTNVLVIFYLANRWLAIRFDCITALVTGLTCLLAVLTHGSIPAATAGLAISYSYQLIGLSQYTMRLAAEASARFTSVERISYYIDNLSQEAPSSVPSSKPGPDWPTEGKITVKNLKMRYRPNLPLVLRGISFETKPSEKVGIVGRTGSGKSSLGVALYRLVEKAHGRITIDGVDISQIGLYDLRSQLSIIPQDPVLFIGTIRYNLDPTVCFTDAEIWQALEKSNMKETISALDQQLQAPVVENGENFSVGERQLICMARALLRNSKILILDEATAAIDTETDSLIQQTIRQAFTHCTILTIAHRLHTILDSDRILVLSNGKVIEYDTPSSLLAQPTSYFRALMAAMEDAKTDPD